MKKVFLIVMIMISILFTIGCEQKKVSINDLINFPDQSPRCIEVLYDDPTISPSLITDDGDVAMIVNALFARVYKEVKTVTPKSNMRIKLIYDTDIEITISLNGITDSSQKKYEPLSDDGLENLILTVLREDNK